MYVAKRAWKTLRAKRIVDSLLDACTRDVGVQGIPSPDPISVSVTSKLVGGSPHGFVSLERK